MVTHWLSPRRKVVASGVPVADNVAVISGTFAVPTLDKLIKELLPTAKPVTAVLHALSPRRNVVKSAVPEADKSDVNVTAPVCKVIGDKLIKVPLEAVNEATPLSPSEAKVILPCWSTVMLAFVYAPGATAVGAKSIVPVVVIVPPFKPVPAVTLVTAVFQMLSPRRNVVVLGVPVALNVAVISGLLIVPTSDKLINVLLPVVNPSRYIVVSTLPSAFKNCTEVPPGFTKEDAVILLDILALPVTLRASPLPLVLFINKPAPSPPLFIVAAVPDPEV